MIDLCLFFCLVHLVDITPLASAPNTEEMASVDSIQGGSSSETTGFSNGTPGFSNATPGKRLSGKPLQ